MGTKQSAKQSSVESVVRELQRQQAEINAKIAALLGEQTFTVSVEQVKRLTQEHWHTLRFALVVGGAEKPQLDKNRKGYALIKGANPSWYMGCKGFEATLRSRADKGLPVELYSDVNPKTGYSQIMRAQEVLTAMHNAKFIDATKGIFAEPKARKTAK